LNWDEKLILAMSKKTMGIITVNHDLYIAKLLYRMDEKARQKR